MKITSPNTMFSRISKSLLIGTLLLLMQSSPVCAKTISVSLVHPSYATGNASLLGGAYFMVLLVVGYAIKWYANVRKGKSENAE